MFKPGGYQRYENIKIYTAVVWYDVWYENLEWWSDSWQYTPCNAVKNPSCHKVQ